MYIRKNIITVSLFSLGIILFSLCFYIGFLKLSNHELKPFEILGVEEIDGEVVYNIESNFYAKSYEVIITNEDDEIILDEKYDTNEGIIKNLKAYYLEELTVKVIAIHDEEIELEATNTYTFTWNSPTFSKSNSIYIPKETNFDILIDGDFTENSYKLQLKNSDKVIKEIAITDQVTTISYDLVSSYSGRISAFVIDENNKKLDSFNFYINTVIIGNVEILSPVTDYLTWDNFVFSYEGGDNADSLLLYIYKKGTKKNTLCRIIGITNNETEININYFEEDTTYILTLVAAYKDYSEISREDTVTFTTGKKSPVGEVYTDVDFASLKPGTKFTLYTNTTGAKIMYSLDGKDPATYGSMYTEPITISSDVTLKAVAIKENMENSITSTFEITVADKTPVVYLSPSNQKSNPGVKSVGYTNEMEMMNKVADVVERVLKASGVTVYRNDPNDNMKTWLTESRNVKSDLHLAIHSNGSVNHDQEGMEIYVHEETSPAYSVAQTIYNDLFYLYQSDGHTVGRGVLFARGRMGEVHPLNIKMGVLIEIAYHDNASDAKWIVDNIDQIGTTIANSILKYFQVN